MDCYYYKDVLISVVLEDVVENCNEGIKRVDEMSWAQSQNEINNYVIELLQKMIDKFDKYSLEEVVIKDIIEELEVKYEEEYEEDYKEKNFEGMELHEYYIKKLQNVKNEVCNIFVTREKMEKMKDENV
jgi:hypothetical protein